MATESSTPRSFQLVCAALLTLFIGSGRAQTVQTGIAEKDFGTLGVNASNPASATLQFQITNLPSAPKFALHYGLDFSAGTPNCTGSSVITCTVQVNFIPQNPGLREDALLIETAGGSLLYTTLLHGVGLGASSLLLPGTMSTIAGVPGMWGFAGDGNLASNANFANQQNITLDAKGNLYIADSINQVVREINPTTHLIKTVAGMPYKPGFSGDGGLATSAKLNSPSSVALDGAGNLYVADYGNNRVRRVDVVTGCISTIAGGGSQRTGSDGLGDGGPATNALLNGPADIAVDASGNLFIADSLNALVRKVDRTTQSIVIYAGVTAGTSASSSANGGPATSASLRYPVGLALSSSGNLYIADKAGNVVREVNSSNGTITTVAGNGNWGFYGDNGPAVSADFEGPIAVRVDAGGNLYIVDSGDNAIREVSAATQTIKTIAGNGSSGYGGDGGNPLNATLSNPAGIAIDPSGNILISDSGNNIVRRVSSTQQLSFPSTVIGLASSAQVLTLLNSGNQPLSLSGLTVASGFSQQSANGNDCTASSVLAAGATCQIGVVFVPVSAGNTTGQLTVSSTSLSAPLKVSLSGTGTGTAGGQVVLSPANLNFGNQTLNTTSATQAVTLTNKTAGTLAISNIWLTGPNSADYKLSTTCTATVPAGTSCSLSVSFAPSGVGSRTAAIVFNDTAANSPQTVSLAGVGAGSPQLAASSSALTFASQGLSAAPSVQTLSLSNTGSASLTINSISINGTNPADFVQTNNCNSLAVGASCSVSVWFAPTIAGTRTATLSISSSASSSAKVVALNGAAASNSQAYKFTIVNGNFEAGSLSGWNVIGSATVGATAHSGSYGLKEQSGITTLTYQDVYGLVPGQSYQISAWVMSSSANATNAQLFVHDTTGQNAAASAYSGSGWQQVSILFTATSTGAVRLHLCAFAAASTTYWDDVTIALSLGNGGFEKGSLSPWNAIGISAISPQAHTGSHGLMEQAASGTTLVYQDVVGLISGQSYVISAWVKSSTATTNGAELWLHDTTGAGITGTLVYPGTGWQQITALFKATNTGAVRIHLCDFAGPETLYWDDVTIAPAVASGDFESGSTAPWLIAGSASLSSVSHAGNFGLTEQPAAGTTLIYQDVHGLTAGQTYVVSAWVKATAATNAVELWLHDTTGQNIAGAIVYPGTGWQRVNTIFTATSTGAVRMHLVAFAGTGSVTWDDVTISGQ